MPIPPEVRLIYLHRGAGKAAVRLGVNRTISGADYEDALLASDAFSTWDERPRTPRTPRSGSGTRPSSSGSAYGDLPYAGAAAKGAGGGGGGSGSATPRSGSAASSRLGHRRNFSTNMAALYHTMSADDTSTSSTSGGGGGGGGAASSVPTAPASFLRSAGNTPAAPASMLATTAAADGADSGALVADEAPVRVRATQAASPVPLGGAGRTPSRDVPTSPEVLGGVGSPELVVTDASASSAPRPTSWSGSSWRLPVFGWTRSKQRSIGSDEAGSMGTSPAGPSVPPPSVASSHRTGSSTAGSTNASTPRSGSGRPVAVDAPGHPAVPLPLASPPVHHGSWMAPSRLQQHAAPMSRSHPDLAMTLPLPGPATAAAQDEAALDASLLATATAAAPRAPADEAQMLREGLLYVQTPDRGDLRQCHVVLSTDTLAVFPARPSFLQANVGRVVPMASVRAIVLRADTDNAIELDVRGDGTYVLQAETRRASEEWIQDILRTVPLAVLSQLIPAEVPVDVPFLDRTEHVPVTVTTTALQCLQQLSLQVNDNVYRTCSLCLRRNDHVAWLEPDDLVLTLPVAFKSHRLQCHRNADRQRAAATPARPPDVEGYLSKLAADGRPGGWKKRFFFTRDGHFFYAKHHNARNGEPANLAADSVGVIPLEDGTAARPRMPTLAGRRARIDGWRVARSLRAPERRAVHSVEADPAHGDQFNVVTPGRVYRLRVRARGVLRRRGDFSTHRRARDCSRTARRGAAGREPRGHGAVGGVAAAPAGPLPERAGHELPQAHDVGPRAQRRQDSQGTPP